MRFHSLNSSFAVVAFVAGAILAAAPLRAQNASTPNASATAAPSSNHPSFTVKVIGQGRPMIMIPGLSSSGATWDATAAHLGGQYKCYELTLAGFAGVPPINEPLLTTVRDQIAAFIRDQHLDRPVIMGHSLGGSIALDLAAHYPQLTGPVVIVDSLPFFAGAWFQSKTLAEAQPAIERMRAGMEAMTPEQWQAYTKSGVSTRGMAANPSDQQTLVEWGLKSDQKTVIGAMMAMLGEDLRPELKSIDQPVLVIGTWVGLKDYGVTEDAVADTFHQQYAGVKDLKFVMAEKARHFVMWDDPQWFYSQVDSFLGNPSEKTQAAVSETK